MLLQDVKLSLRSLRKSKGFLAAAIMTLALGVGVNTAMFTLIDALMLKPLPFPDPGRLAMVYETDNRPTDQPFRLSNRRKMFADSGQIERWAELSRSFDSLGGYRYWRLTAMGEGAAERLDAGIVVGDLFRVLRVKPAIGRGFTKAEKRPEGARVAILGHGYWLRRFGGDRGVLGRTVQLDGHPFTIVGVMPARFAPVLPRGMPRTADVWTTAMVDFTAVHEGKRSWTVCQAIGRLKPGVSFTQAQAEMDAVAKHLESEHRRFRQRGVNLQPAQDELAADLRPALLALFAAVGCVLLIACANIAGLMLARQAARRRDIAIRAVLGAGRWRIARQCLVESVLVSCAGGAAGLLLSRWVLKAVGLLSPNLFARAGDVRVDATVLLFAFALSLATGVLLGALPAISAVRWNLNSLLKDAAAGRRGAFSPRNVLVAAEVALAVVLLSGAGLLLRSFILLRGVDIGFSTRNVIAAGLPLPETKYKTAAEQQALIDALTPRLERMPGVEAVGFTNSMALAGTFMMSADFQIEGRPSTEKSPEANIVPATPGYFAAAGIPLVSGRYFTASEAARGNAVLINRTAARSFFAHEPPLGHRILSGFACKSCEIVGVVGDIKNFGLARETVPEIYVPLGNLAIPTVDLVVRTRSDPRPVIAAVRSEVRAVAPDVAIDRIRTMEEVLADHTAGQRFNAMLLGIFAMLALLLAGIGVFGVIAYSVTQRTREIGVRMALGAQRPAVLATVLGRGVAIAAVGVAAGIAVSFAATRLLRTLLFGVAPHDPATLAGVAAAVLAVAAAAAWAPALRATRVDPMIALRHE